MPLPHNAFALFSLQKAFAYGGSSIPRHGHRELADSPEVLGHSLGDRSGLSDTKSGFREGKLLRRHELMRPT